MAGRGTRATAVDFNNIRATVNNVLGVGAGQTGYGQTLLSTAAQPGAVIASTLWNNIRTDMSKARVHQTNVAVADGTANDGQTLRLITPTTTITEDIRLQYATFADRINTDRNLAAAGQLTPSVVMSGLGPVSRSDAWGGAIDTISHTVTITFPGYGSISGDDHARAFFNAGGSIQIGAALASGTGSKGSTWSTMLSSVGTYSLRSASSTITGSVNTGGALASGTGFYSLTVGAASPGTTVLTQAAAAGKYVENRYIIQVRRPSNNTLAFIITYQDNDAGDKTGTGGPVDEDVGGTVTTTFTCTRPSGSNVDVLAPTGTSSTL
jgi:hypothetical protein